MNKRATTIQDIADAIQLISIFPKDSIAARRVAHRTCNIFRLRYTKFLPSIEVQKELKASIIYEKINSLERRSPDVPKLQRQDLWTHVKNSIKEIISSWTSSRVRVSHLLHLVELAKLHHDGTTFKGSEVYPRVLKIGLCVQGNDEERSIGSKSQISQSLSSLLLLMVKDQGLEATEKQLIECLYQVATSENQIRAIKKKFPRLVEKYDEIVQREQLAAMLLVSNNATIVKNLFHQYQIDHGLPLPMEMYGDLISACTRFYTIYFMLEIFHIMVFRHGMKPYLWMFDHLTTLMTLQYVKDKVMGEEQAFITMEMCHRVLTIMNYSIDREFEGHVFERMLAVFTLMFGMEGSQKLYEVYHKRRNNDALPMLLLTPPTITRIIKRCRAINKEHLAMEVFMEMTKLPYTIDVYLFQMLLWNITHPRHLKGFLPAILEKMPQHISAKEIRSCLPFLKDALKRVYSKRQLRGKSLLLSSSYIQSASTVLIDTLAHSAEGMDCYISMLNNHVAAGTTCKTDTTSCVQETVDTGSYMRI